jgi:LacI family transcriptional regulator
MTIAEIAQLAGVSIGTVDRVIHERGKVAPATRSKVDEVISRFGYAPDIVARQLKLKTVLRVGLLFPAYAADAEQPFPRKGAGSSYWNMVLTGVMQAAETFKPFKIELLPAYWGYSKDTLLPKVSKGLLEQHIDALILSPAAPKEVRELTKKMKHIPYIYVDSPLADTKPMVTIMQNPYSSGQTAGRVMKLLKGKGNFLSLRISGNAYNLVERTRGFRDFFSGDTDVSVTEITLNRFVPETIFPALDKVLGPQRINGIFVPHAEVHLAAEYLLKRKLNGKIALIGYDTVPINCEFLRKGVIDCLIAQHPDQQGYEAMHEIYRRFILNQECNPLIEIPIDIYFRENI